MQETFLTEFQKRGYFNQCTDRVSLDLLMSKKKIKAYSHYSPLHNSKMGRLISQKKHNCKNSQETSDRILRLPIFYDLTFKNLKYIIATIKKSS